MKNLFTGLVISVTALSSGITSASIANWVNNPEPNLNGQEQMVEQKTQSLSTIGTQTSKSSELSPSNPEFTKPTRIESTQRDTQYSTSDIKAVSTDPKNVIPIEDAAAKHLSQVSKFISNSSVTGLKTDDYLAVVLLNSALVQAGLDVKLSIENQTTQNLFKSAVGCINSKKNESLNTIAKNLISDHLNVVDIKKFISSSPSIGAAFTAKCM